MAGSALFFVVLGVSFVSGILMKGILWLDEPKKSRRPRYAH